MNTRTPFAIISAERPEYTADVNAWRSASLRHQLESRDLAPTEVCGRYAGRNETSYAIPLEAGEAGHAYRTMLPSLARRWGQESWLYVDANGFVTLNYSDGRIESLGMWELTTPEAAKASDAYTYAPLQGAYYTVRRAV